LVSHELSKIMTDVYVRTPLLLTNNFPLLIYRTTVLVH
jgi:hypothetical protein